MPFLTDLDENARVKGSRDPLGIVPVWSSRSFGRAVVGNLTTATNSVRGFTTLLIGLYLAEEVKERGGSESELDVFLKFEQMAAYCRRHLNGDVEFRGFRRVNARLAEGTRVPISGQQQEQLLSNQKQYGLWGLFATAAQLSGFIAPGGRRLSDAGREFTAREYIAQLPAKRRVSGGELIDLLSTPRFTLELNGKHSALCTTIAKLHARDLLPRERDVYRDRLAFGGDVEVRGRQERVARAMATITSDDFGFVEFRALRGMLANDEELTPILAKIETIEQLLVPIASLFGFLLLRRGQRVADVAAEVEKSWGAGGVGSIDPVAIGALRAELVSATGDELTAESWISLAKMAASGDYLGLIRQLLRHNARVMQRRNGSAPWVTEENGALRVHMSDETSPLLDRDELASTWKSTYFLNSLARVVREVGV